MLQASGSALVAGQREHSDEGVWVQVVRGLFFEGVAYAPGSVLHVPKRFAQEYGRLGKIILIAAPEPHGEQGPRMLHLAGELSVDVAAIPTMKPKRGKQL